MKKTLITLLGLALLTACNYQDKKKALNDKTIPTIPKTEKMKKIQFNSEGIQLVGNLYYPENYTEGQQYPAIVVSGSWTTVKEQMAGLYAEKMAKEGFITLAFDFRNFGESEGEPRFFESPKLKKDDIKNAVTFLAQQKDINPNTDLELFQVTGSTI